MDGKEAIFSVVELKRSFLLELVFIIAVIKKFLRKARKSFYSLDFIFVTIK